MDVRVLREYPQTRLSFSAGKTQNLKRHGCRGVQTVDDGDAGKAKGVSI